MNQRRFFMMLDITKVERNILYNCLRFVYFVNGSNHFKNCTKKLTFAQSNILIKLKF